MFHFSKGQDTIDPKCRFTNTSEREMMKIKRRKNRERE